MALGTCHILFPRGRNNVVEVNARLHATPECFHEAMEDGVWQGVALVWAMVHFWFPSLVNVYEVAGGFPVGIDPSTWHS